MKKLLLVALCAILVAALFVGCDNEKPPVDGTDSSNLVTDPVTDPPETDPPETDPPETVPPETGPVEPNGEFEIVLGEPTVVFRAPEGVQGWGRHQFPSIGYTADGLIRVVWHDGEDKVGAQNVMYRRTSMNGGKSWIPGTTMDNSYTRILMENGKYFAGWDSKGTVSDISLSGYTPAGVSGDVSLYLVDDLKDDPALEKLYSFGIKVYDPETGKVSTMQSILNWPYATVSLHPGGHIMTVSAKVAQSNNVYGTEEGYLYASFYCTTFDSTAATREEALASNISENSVFVICSKDSGRTWDVLKQFTATPEQKAQSVDYLHYESYYEGFNENAFVQTATGDLFILMRTGMSRTLFCSRSADGGETWTEAEPFDDIGCLPNLLQLECGVTLATYGRPELRIRATSDPSCATWEDPITIQISPEYENYRNRSCFYTGMIALDDNTALMVYADFHYPNKNGVGVRTILVRRIHVVPVTPEA